MLGGGLLGRWRAAEPAPAAAIERRRSVRQTIVAQVARLAWEGGEELCMLRDLSPGGLCADVYWALPAGTALTVELPSGHRMEGTVRWARGGQIGVQFTREVAVMELITHCSVDARIGTARPPRLECDLPATVRIADDPADETAASVRNVSQAGMMLAVAHPIANGTRCDVLLDHLGWVSGTVRWSRGTEAGLLLAAPIAYPDFADWRRALRETAAPPPHAARRVLLADF